MRRCGCERSANRRPLASCDRALGNAAVDNIVKLNVSLGTSLLLFGLAAASVNILVGYTGLDGLRNAAFFGVGAYGSALFTHYIMPDNMILAAVVGAIDRNALGAHPRVHFSSAAVAFTSRC